MTCFCHNIIQAFQILYMSLFLDTETKKSVSQGNNATKTSCDIISVKHWPKNAHILESKDRKPQKLGNFPFPSQPEIFLELFVMKFNSKLNRFDIKMPPPV